MKLLNGLSVFFQRNASPLMGAVVILLLGYGYSLFLPSSIVPALQAQSKLTLQMADSKKALVDARATAAAPVDEVKSRIANAQATLSAEANVLVADTQIIPSIDAIYGYADQSGVTVVDLQSEIPGVTHSITVTSLITGTAPQPTATPPAAAKPNGTPQASPSPTVQPTARINAYHFTTVRLQVRGASHQLVDFVSRMREAYAKSFIIGDVTLLGDESSATMSMKLLVYSSPYASGEALVMAPLPSKPLPTLSPPTPRAAPTAYHMYLVQWGDTLLSLASRFGTTVQAIMDANGLSDSRIYSGQQLTIPGDQAPDSPINVDTTGYSSNPQMPSGLPVHGTIAATFHDADYLRRFGKIHQGVDIAVNVGTPVQTTMSGKVAYAAEYDSWGNLVAVENGEWLVIFAHLSQINVQQSQSVNAGDVIGLSGNTGNSSGPHVHYEVHDNGTPVDPPGQQN